jgi:hypothetical protein
MMKLAKYLKTENIYITDTCKDTGSFYGEFSLFLKERGLIEDVKKVKRLFVKRESIQSTGISKGIFGISPGRGPDPQRPGFQGPGQPGRTAYFPDHER